MSLKQEYLVSDLEELKVGPITTGGNIDPTVFKIRNILEEPGAKLYTTLELHILIHNASIDLEVPYQRGHVWPKTKQMKFIDSLFHNCYIPPIVFALMQDECGGELLACVDGKQRLTSIVKFLCGQVSFQNFHPETQELWWYLVPPALQDKRREISPKGKKMFESIQIACVEHRALSHAMGRRVFQRVQLGVCLSAAEKLQAIASPWAECVHMFCKQYFFDDAGLANVKFNAKRGRKFRNFVSILYRCEDVDQLRTPSAAQLGKWLERPGQPSRSFQFQVERMFSDLLKIANNKTLNKGLTIFSAMVSPAEFVLFIGVLLYALKPEDFRIEEKSAAIFHLRYELRCTHQDVRLNSRVCQHSWDIINAVIGHRVDVTRDTMLQGVLRNDKVTGVL
ncbi:hypothetical protein EI94DRAFT_1873093 [Lactarius quietus]|nr:hypothetical protein EI94DRAFT_1873093 [Lactarius quietus]